MIEIDGTTVPVRCLKPGTGDLASSVEYNPYKVPSYTKIYVIVFVLAKKHLVPKNGKRNFSSKFSF